MSTPVATIADALIAFILSLLRDPSAVEEFAAAPKAMLANNGLDDTCAADVRAVKPVIVDHASVAARTVQPQQQQQYPPGTQFDNDPDPTDPVSEITRILNQFTSIDARTTIIDQSTNQNIWTEGGDVTQIFDQEAVVASGDHAVAAGDDANLIDTDLDVTIGDVSVGNTDIEGSFNETDTDSDEPDPLADEPLAAADAPAESEFSDVAQAVGGATETAVDAAMDATQAVIAEPVAEPAVEQPADLLETDLTATDTTYESDAAASAAAAGEPLLEEPAEEQ
jgi:translation elongation factor EF-G